MKKLLFVPLLAFPVLLFFPRWGAAPPLRAQVTGDSGVMSFRAVFGERQAASKDYSGTVSVSDGGVRIIQPWRFFGADAVDGSSGWKLQTKYANFENQPDQPRSMSTPGPGINVVPAGVTV